MVSFEIQINISGNHKKKTKHQTHKVKHGSVPDFQAREKKAFV